MQHILGTINDLSLFFNVYTLDDLGHILYLLSHGPITVLKDVNISFLLSLSLCFYCIKYDLQ
jgi:archaellum biogenesis protein FlaJ (TadC family)